MASARLRLGLRTSPAMKVMSCQESAENSEPDWATHSATIKPKNTTGRNAERGVVSAQAEHIREVHFDRGGVPAEHEAGQDEGGQSNRLCRGEDILHEIG